MNRNLSATEKVFCFPAVATEATRGPFVLHYGLRIGVQNLQ
jgi:hypothetical protein